MADEAKAKGNSVFATGNYTDAARHFTETINLAPANHVLFSNRSAAYASLNKFSDALSDAQKTIELKPDWSKGYSRLGAAHMGLHSYNDAVTAYKKGLEIDPNNEPLKSGLADSEAALARSSRSRPGPGASPFGDAFGPDMWVKLSSDPTTCEFLHQPDFVKMLQDIQKNPNNLNLYSKDQRMMQALGLLLNLKFQTRGPEEDAEMAETSSHASPERKKPAAAEADPVNEDKRPEPEQMDKSEEEEEKMEKKAQAQKENAAGNAAYKKKDFETAIQHYTKAIELDDDNISFLTNRAAVHLEMGKVQMLPKRKATDKEKGKGKASGPSTRHRYVEEPTDDGEIPRFQTEEIKESYKTKWAPRKCQQERQVTREDFPNHLLELVIQHCGWHKVAGLQHPAYHSLVKEFFANFNTDIDVPESSHRHETWVRGKWIRFSPTMIEQYYGLTRTGIDPLPTMQEQDMALVARFLYGRYDAWPLDTPRFMHDRLTKELRTLHIFISSNISPTRQRTRFNENRAILLYHLAHVRKLDLGAHIFEFIRELATEVYPHRTIQFSCLISGICLTQGVPTLPTEEAEPPAALLNAISVNNSVNEMKGSGNRVQPVPAVEEDGRYHGQAPLAPLPAPTVGSDISTQLAQLLAAQTEMGRAISNIHRAVLQIQQTQVAMHSDMRTVNCQVRDLQQTDTRTRSDQRTLEYQYNVMNKQMSWIGSRMETIDETVDQMSGTVSRISETVESLRPSTSAGLSDWPDPFFS